MAYNVTMESGFKKQINSQSYTAVKNDTFGELPHK